MDSDRGGNLRRVTAGGDNRVAGAQGGLDDVDTQTSASAGDEPYFSFGHAMFLTRVMSDQEAST